MKIRTGFVSNSSSSSFIIYGYKMSKDEILATFPNFINEFGDFNDEFYDDERFIDYEDGYFFGKTLADWDDEDYLESIEFDTDFFHKNARELKRALNRIDNPKLYVGTRPS